MRLPRPAAAAGRCPARRSRRSPASEPKHAMTAQRGCEVLHAATMPTTGISQELRRPGRHMPIGQFGWPGRPARTPEPGQAMLDRPAGTTATSAWRGAIARSARAAADAAMSAALNGAAVLAILRRRKWLLLASMLLCPLLAYVAITQLTPRYTATGTLLYDASEYNGARDCRASCGSIRSPMPSWPARRRCCAACRWSSRSPVRLNLLTNPGVQHVAAAAVLAAADTGRDSGGRCSRPRRLRHR